MVLQPGLFWQEQIHPWEAEWEIALGLKRISQYSNNQLILLVGEGDFSFSSALATAFGTAHNIVATSLDSRQELLQKYGQKVAANLSELERRGAQVLHGVDVRNMANIYQSGLGDRLRLFDRIIYNFPHAGFTGPEKLKPVIKKHRELLGLFFENASKMLLHGGEVHVTHKLGPPYDEWGLVEQAQASGLDLKGAPQEFHRSTFPGYHNRRGAYCSRTGALPGASFGLGKCATFIFHLSSKCAQRKESTGLGPQIQRTPGHCVQDSIKYEGINSLLMYNTPFSDHFKWIHRQQTNPGIPIFPDNMHDEFYYDCLEENYVCIQSRMQQSGWIPLGQRHGQPGLFRDTQMGHPVDHFRVLHTTAPVNFPMSIPCHFSEHSPPLFYSSPMNWGF